MFVGNVSFDTSVEALTAHMQRAGTVASADIPTRPDGRSKVGGAALRVWMRAVPAREVCATMSPPGLRVS